MSNITMDDIARVANVSKSTVSRALSYDPRVNDDTREEIVRIAREMNYRPHKVAQALAKKNTNILGIVLPSAPRSLADPFFLEFLQGIGEAAVDKNYSLTLSNITPDSNEELTAVFSRNKVDGIILTEPYLDDSRIRYLKEENIPFVFLGNPMASKDICWVETDNLQGSYQAVDYLIRQGHNKIATISGLQGMVAGKYRLEGYKKALIDHGLKVEPGLIYQGDFTQQGAYRAAKKLLKNRRDFSAVFAANDLMAIAVIKALKEENINIPSQVAVMGYDGIQLGEYIEPPLSTIRLPSREMGRIAVNLLMKIINKEEVDKKQVLLPPVLTIRGSA